MIKQQIKIIKGMTIEKLQIEINEFLKTIPGTVHNVKIKYINEIYMKYLGIIRYDQEIK